MSVHKRVLDDDEVGFALMPREFLPHNRHDFRVFISALARQSGMTQQPPQVRSNTNAK